jgi:hypothetical protein
MKHPLFQPGETCWARVPTSQGTQWMECDITGPLARRMIRDLDLKPIGYALAYMVLMDGATMETPWPECDLHKKWQRSDWQSLKQIWQPKREAR